MKESRYTAIDGIGQILLERSARASRIVISVRPQKGVRVAVPRRASFEAALQFVHTKKRWIKKHLEKLETWQHENADLSGSFAAIDRAAAKNRITARLVRLAAEHGFSYNKVYIRNQKTRWGSCSHDNNISLNMKLAILPEALMDYVILHELVHTRFHNHSRQFWAELDRYTGGGKKLAARLKEYNLRLI